MFKYLKCNWKSDDFGRVKVLFQNRELEELLKR